MTQAITRIQLSRKKGWKMPPNTVKVDRSTRWGNPWPVGAEGPDGRVAPDAEGAVGMFEDMLADPQKRAEVGYPEDAALIAGLRGASLACWCRLDQPCHADVLLGVVSPPGDAVEKGGACGP